MNPLEIYQKTAKNNCGECGYPTCLAFAASVVTVGENPGKCSFMDTTGLEIPTQAPGEMEDQARKKDLALVAYLKNKVADLDFSELGPSLGVQVSATPQARLLFRYLGQAVEISRDGILINGIEPKDPRDQILLYNYVHMGGGNAPPSSEEWLGLESLPNSISKVRTLSVYAEEPIAELFCDQSMEQRLRCCQELDGVPLAESSASLACHFQVLPRLPIQVHFWEAEPEDGFEAKVKILFDHKVLSVLDIESLVFSAERLAERLRDL